MHTLLTSARFKTQSATSCGCFFKGEAIMVNQKFARRPLATTALKGLDESLQRLELSLLNDGYANQLLSFLETLLFFLFSDVDEDGSWWKCRAMKGCEEGKVCVRERTERSGQHRLWSCETGGSVLWPVRVGTR